MDNPHLNRVLEALLELRGPLSDADQRLSLTLYHLLAQGKPVGTEALARSASQDRARVDAVLSQWPGLYRDEQGHVIGYWGLTIAKMGHRMLVDERVLYAWCAWDTLFLPELLGRAARVESACPATGATIVLDVTQDAVTSEGTRPFVSFIVPDPKQATADVVSSFCHYVYFFATESAARAWTAAHPGTVVATLDEAWELGRLRNARVYPGRRFASVAGDLLATS